MKLKEILLRKLDSLLNPKFENKVIISFFSLGSLLVVVPSIIAYTATFSVENEGTSFIAEINNTPDIFITTLGVICLATSVYFNYRKINREDYTEKKENSRTVSCQTFNNSTIHSDVIQIIGKDLELVDVPTISDLVLNQASTALLKNFQPHSILGEFPDIDKSIRNSFSSFEVIDRYVLGAGENKNLRLPAHELLHQPNNKHLISAHGGAGKTHLLWTLGKSLLDDVDLIPIYLSLRDFSSIDDINFYLNTLNKGLSLELIAQNEKVVFLFDGLTEFSNEKNQLKEIRNLFGLLSSSKVITTSRSIDIVTNNEKWTLELINQTEIREFLIRANIDVDNIDSSLFELLSYPLILTLFVLLDSKSNSVSELFSEYFYRLTSNLEDKKSLLKVLSLTVMEMEAQKCEMKWSIFESKYYSHCESEGLEKFKPLLDKVGLFNKRGTILEPIHDVYWEWLVGCGLLYAWNERHVFYDLRLRDSLNLSLGTRFCSIPHETELLNVLTIDIIFAARFYRQVRLNSGYKNFTEKFKYSIKNLFISDINSEKFRGIIAAFSSGDEVFFDESIEVLSDLKRDRFDVTRIYSFISNEILWERRTIIARYFSTRGDLYVLRKVIENTGERKWADWAEELYIEGKIEFCLAISIYFSCSDYLPRWIENNLIEFLANQNQYWLRAASERGKNEKLAWCLLKNYELICPKNGSSGWFDVNKVLVQCGSDALFESITDNFNSMSDWTKEIISYALKDRDKKWTARLQSKALESNISNEAKNKIIDVIDESLNEQVLRNCLCSDDEKVQGMGWIGLAKKFGVDILDELIENLPETFANIHYIPALKAMSEIEGLPESLIAVLNSKLGSPMMPMATQDYIIAMGSIKPNGVLNILNMIRQQPFIFHTYHFNLFAQIFSKWTKESGVKIMADHKGHSFTILEYFLLLQLERENATEWFDLVVKYAKHRIVYEQIAVVIETQFDSSDTTIRNFKMSEYNTDVYQALKNNVDALQLYKIHQAVLHFIPSDELNDLTIRIITEHNEESSTYLYYLSMNPNYAHNEVYKVILNLYINDDAFLDCCSYISTLISVLSVPEIKDMLAPLLSKHSNKVIEIIRLIELSKGSQLIKEDLSLICE